MPDLIYTPDHEARALDDLLTPYKGKPRIEALVRALATSAQDFEDEVFGQLTSRTLAASSGAQLEQWGEFVGEARQGLEDPEYRRFIMARLLANRSQGRVDELVSIFSIITAPSTVRYHDHFPAGFRLTAYRELEMSAQLRSRVRRLMRSIKPAGIGMTLTEARADSIQLGEAARGFGSTFSRIL